MGKGGGGGGVKVKPGPLELAQADIAKRQDVRAQQLETEFMDPIRGMITPQLLQTLGYGSPFSTKLSASERAPIEGQYNQAKQAIMNTAQRGGRLRSQMMGLERDRAGAISSASNMAKQRGIERALQFAGGALPTAAGVQGMTGQALSGLGSAQSSAQQRALQEAQMKAQADASKGQGMGSLLGAGLGAAMMFMSSREFKEDIQPVEFDCLRLVDTTPVYTWRYINDNRTHIGPVTEEAPAIIVTEDGKALVPIDYLGLMFAAIKQLSTKVQILEQRI